MSHHGAKQTQYWLAADVLAAGMWRLHSCVINLVKAELHMCATIHVSL